MRQQRAVAGVLSAIAAVLLGASAAFACVAATSDPFLAAPEPARATAGSTVTVRGTNWSTNSPVELRWASETGPVLGKAVVDREGAFTLSTVVPQAAPGTYRVIAVQGARNDVQNFTIPAPLTPIAIEGGSSGSPTQAGTAVTGTPVINNRTSGGATQSPAPTPTPSPAAVNTSPAPAATSNPVPSAGTLLGSSPPTGALASPEPAAAAALSDEPARIPGRLVSGDLWSGFAPGDGGSFRGPSLTDGVSTSTSSLPGPEMAVALFGTALVAMFGGFAFAELRRRRVLAPISQSPPSMIEAAPKG